MWDDGWVRPSIATVNNPSLFSDVKDDACRASLALSEAVGVWKANQLRADVDPSADCQDVYVWCEHEVIQMPVSRFDDVSDEPCYNWPRASSSYMWEYPSYSSGRELRDSTPNSRHMGLHVPREREEFEDIIHYTKDYHPKHKIWHQLLPESWRKDSPTGTRTTLHYTDSAGDEKLWHYDDPGAQCFKTSSDGGPDWSVVSRRTTSRLVPVPPSTTSTVAGASSGTATNDQREGDSSDKSPRSTTTKVKDKKRWKESRKRRASTPVTADAILDLSLIHI